jgi:hypothetical protein
MGTYDLKGLDALEEHYARNLKAYYEALTVGPSHNYYMGRAEADITKWIAYFIEGMATSFDKVRDQALREDKKGGKDQSKLLRNLDSKQRRALTLFQRSREIAAKNVADLFGYKARTTALLCQRWVRKAFWKPPIPPRNRAATNWATLMLQSLMKSTDSPPSKLGPRFLGST